MQKGNERIGNPGDEVTESGVTYVMTNYPYTQPMIFNTIKASISKGIVYAAVTIAAFVMFGAYNYLNFFMADVAMIAVMLYICLVVKPKVCRCQIARVGVADGFSIKLAGETLGFMWSAFARLPILMIWTRGSIPGNAGVLTFYPNNSLKIISLIVGVVISLIALFTLTSGKESVEQNHRRTMAFYKRAIGYKDPRVEIENTTRTYSYGEIRNNVFGPIKKPAPQSQSKTVVPDEVSVPDMNNVEPQEPEQPRVNRKRRNIDI